MDAPAVDLSSLLNTDEPLTDEQFSDVVVQVRQSARQRSQFGEWLTGTADKDRANLGKNPALAMKVAQGFYALADYSAAVEWLDQAGTAVQHCYLKGRSLRSLGDYEQAIAQFEQAEAKGHDGFQIGMEIVDCLRSSGQLEQAAEKLKRFSRIGEIRAAYHFQVGRLSEANGDHEQALAEYEQAIALDADYTEALFHLAYACDLYGDEEEAEDYYERCIESGPVHINALLNLAVLYEYRKDYDHAIRCVRRVLNAYPNQQRARMFLKDIQSSMTMHIDEEQERRLDQQNQVLQIPISDFELSVRSRNCLKKMNIRYLGDLLKVSEAELLAYKNFGETSLQEIKTILGQKKLRLGQMLEDRGNGMRAAASQADADEEEDELLSMPISQLELSVRARKCLQKLNITAVGDLTSCTEAELLGCKNFGQTSLAEIQQCLKDNGLALRSLDN